MRFRNRRMVLGFKGFFFSFLKFTGVIWNIKLINKIVIKQKFVRPTN